MLPEPVREALKLWQPTPLHRARRLERELGTPARIYYKYDAYLAGKLEDPEFSEADMQAALERLPETPAIA
jgi:tryptophan synthase beta chain